MVGQEKLKAYFKRAIENKAVPRFIMLCGAKGQGKKTFVEWLLGEMKYRSSREDALKIENIRHIKESSIALSEKTAYLLFDADNMTIQAQNALLKFVEEPPRNAYIIVTAQHEKNLLSTISSRASVHHLARYTATELAKFTDDKELLSMCENPGQIRLMSGDKKREVLALANKIKSSLSRIAPANVFNILKHIEKEDYELLLNSLLYLYSQQLIQQPNKLGCIRVIYDYKAFLNHKSLNKANLLEMMFIKLREEELLSELR